MIKTLAGLNGDIPSEVINLAGLAMSKLETSDKNLKDRFEQTSARMIQENNIIIVTKMLVDDVINESFDKIIEENEKNLPIISENIESGSFTETPSQE